MNVPASVDPLRIRADLLPFGEAHGAGGGGA